MGSLPVPTADRRDPPPRGLLFDPAQLWCSNLRATRSEVTQSVYLSILRASCAHLEELGTT
jgi:hypothetical protein